MAVTVIPHKKLDALFKMSTDSVLALHLLNVKGSRLQQGAFQSDGMALFHLFVLVVDERPAVSDLSSAGNKRTSCGYTSIRRSMSMMKERLA
jgi:hypothetical protein